MCVDVFHVVIEKMNTTAEPPPAMSDATRACLTASSWLIVWNTKNPTR